MRELNETFTETSGVELVDGEGADAALRATWTTDQEVAAAATCVDESRVEDLNEFAVANWARMGEGDQGY